MPASFWGDYQAMNIDDQVVAMLLVILKTYKICFDFHIDVTIRKWNSICKSVTYDDNEMEFNEVAARDEFVDSWSDQTKHKVASTLHFLNSWKISLIIWSTSLLTCSKFV